MPVFNKQALPVFNKQLPVFNKQALPVFNKQLPVFNKQALPVFNKQALPVFNNPFYYVYEPCSFHFVNELIMKKLPVITPSPKRLKDDPVTAQLKKIIRRGVGYCLMGIRSTGPSRFTQRLYPVSCHQAIHQVTEILVWRKLGIPLDNAISRLSVQSFCHYRRELSGGRYARLTDIYALPLLSSVLYQMVTGHRFDQDASGIPVFSVIPEAVHDIVRILLSNGHCDVMNTLPLTGALATMDMFPSLYMTDNTIWIINVRKGGIKRIDLFYPILAAALVHSTSPVSQVGVINPYTSEYVILPVKQFSQKVYKELITCIRQLSSD